MTLDHGLLNVPLHKRGNIDAQIDRYKAGLAATEKADRKARETARRLAKPQAVALFEAATQERLAALAAHAKCTVAELRRHLKSQCHWEPQFVVKLLTTTED